MSNLEDGSPWEAQLIVGCRVVRMLCLSLHGEITTTLVIPYAKWDNSIVVVKLRLQSAGRRMVRMLSFKCYLPPVIHPVDREINIDAYPWAHWACIWRVYRARNAVTPLIQYVYTKLHKQPSVPEVAQSTHIKGKWQPQQVPSCVNRWVSQMRAHPAACHELAGDYSRFAEVPRWLKYIRFILIVFWTLSCTSCAWKDRLCVRKMST